MHSLYDLANGEEEISILAKSNVCDVLRKQKFKYIASNIPSDSCDIDPREISYEGCACSQPRCGNECSCLQLFGSSYRILPDGQKVLQNLSKCHLNENLPPIVECNTLCKCGPRCSNREVQNGIRIPLEVFNSAKKGFGLRSSVPIIRGQFVCEYAGEVINKKEACLRTRKQLPTDMNYIIAVREHTSSGHVTETFVDPVQQGNAGRFANHSCDPNLVMIPIRVDSVVPKLALFACRDIAPREELTFHYGGTTGRESEHSSKRRKYSLITGRANWLINPYKMDSVLSEYQASLAELTFNSKPHINMLTVLAEENVNFASDIVKIIETRLMKVQLKRKLPVLYLIDSIVKNFGDVYMNLFSKNLITTFLNIFEKADGKIRADLYKLRSTWDTTFSLRLLQKLDQTIRHLDHNWPMRSRKHSHSHSRSRNPLALGESGSSPRRRFSTDDDIAKYNQPSASQQEQQEEIEEVIEEEEIELDEESLGALEQLEEKLKKRQAELNRLEYLESTQPEVTYKLPDKVEAFVHPSEPYSRNKVESNEEENAPDLKMDLDEYPVIPMETIEHNLPPEPDENAETSARPTTDVSTNDEHWEAQTSSFEPRNKRRNQEIFEHLNKNRVISHFSPHEESPHMTAEVNPDQVEVKLSDPPVQQQAISISTQTADLKTADVDIQNTAEMKDETTQYRYRRKTKNFMSQYRVPAKTVGTYFKIKTKEAETQYDPPLSLQDAAADSTCLPLEDDIARHQQQHHPHSKVENNHSLHILRSLRQQRDLGMLCDITLAAQGEAFKAHKSLLVACSDFFHTLFASEEIKQTPLSFIELQGITASALSLVLDYIYTSEVVVGDSIKSVHEIITAAKRLKIHSLFPVCEILEEALASDQDITGWVISNTELIAPNHGDQSFNASDALPSHSEEEMSPPEDDVSSDENHRDADTSAHVGKDVNKKNRVETPKKPVKRSSSLAQHDRKATKRKERSQSAIEEPNKRKKSDDSELEKTHLCPHCSKKFWKERNLRFHIKKMHADVERATNGEKTKKTSDPASKANREESENPSRCKQCGQTFKSPALLGAHTKKHHRKDRQKRPKTDDQNPAAKDKNAKSEADGRTNSKNDGEPVVEIRAVQESPPGIETSKPRADNHKSSLPAFGQQQDGDDPANVRLRLYQCELCEEIFSVQCFYKAHMASHRQNSEVP